MFLGIDTSNYTTSLAVVDEEGVLLEDKRRILPVEAGKHGLQQSTALFCHLKNLPELISTIFNGIEAKGLLAVAASSKPRPQESSYMPVFKAGEGFAQSIAAVLGLPFYRTTHQEGHVSAGIWSIKKEELAKALVFHLSGGTTELLLIKKIPECNMQYKIEILGSSSDIQAGQLIDRVGVSLGLPFPSGPALEKLAMECDNLVGGKEKGVLIPSSVKGLAISFSGAETKAKEYLRHNVPRARIARAVEHCVAVSVEKVIRRAIESTMVKDVVIIGGVAANGYLRNRLRQRLEHRAVGARLHFPESRYCSDNAVGVGLIARSIFASNK